MRKQSVSDLSWQTKIKRNIPLSASERQQYRAYYRNQKKKQRTTVHGRAADMWNNAKNRAEREGLDFSLTVNWVEERLKEGKCQRTDIPFNLTTSAWTNNNAPSIDRADNRLGYTPENCEVVVWQFNRAKGSQTYGELLEFAYRLLRKYFDSEVE